MSALDIVQARVYEAGLLWTDHQSLAQTLPGLRRAVHGAPLGAVRSALAAQLDELEAKSRVVTEAALVRLVTGWEVFLRDLLVEYVAKRPGHFAFLRVGTRRSSLEVADEIVQFHKRPFQGRNGIPVLVHYLGSDLLKSSRKAATDPDDVDLRPVNFAVAARNAIVHTRGDATGDFREEFPRYLKFLIEAGRLTDAVAAPYKKSGAGKAPPRITGAPHDILRRRMPPPPSGWTGPTSPTYFDRMLADVEATARALHTRALQVPRM